MVLFAQCLYSLAYISKLSQWNIYISLAFLIYAAIIWVLLLADVQGYKLLITSFVTQSWQRKDLCPSIWAFLSIFPSIQNLASLPTSVFRLSRDFLCVLCCYDLKIHVCMWLWICSLAMFDRAMLHADLDLGPTTIATCMF